MKKFALLFLFYLIFLSCKKDNTPPADLKLTTGILHYDLFPEGRELFYVTDTFQELLILKNYFPTKRDQYLYYKEFVGLHSGLYFIDKGEKGCVEETATNCPYRLIEPVGFKKE